MLFEILLPAAIGLVMLIKYLLCKPTPLWKEEGMKMHGPGSRRLGSLEKMMAKLGDKADCNISTIIFLQSKFPLTEVIFRRALTALAQKHPLLRMRLGKENGKFTYMKEIKDFTVDLEVCHTDNWLGLMEDQLPKIYDAEKGPLWNVKLIPETSYDDGGENYYPYQAACIFTFHHVITDGPSFLRLFGEFVEGLNRFLDDDQSVVESGSLLPPLDGYIDTAKIYSPMYNLKTNVLNMVSSVPAFLNFLLKTFSTAALFVKKPGVEIDRNPQAPKKTSLIPVELTKQQTSQLLASCKKHKTTVQCVIQTAACLAYSGMAEGGKFTRTHRINCLLSCNLRKFLDTDELTNYFGMYMSAFMMNTVVGPAMFFWDIVGNVAADLQGKLKAHEPFVFFTLFTQIANSKADENPFDVATAGHPGQRSHDLAFDNYGNFNFLNRNENSHVKITGYFGGAAVHNNGSVFENMLATVNGKLSWTFHYCPHICRKEQAQKYADMTIDTLLKAIQD